MTYNTTSKRIVGSLQILEDIDEYESQWANFIKTEGISMAQFVTGGNPAADGYNRQIMLGCLDTIIGNCKEASFLDGYAYKTNDWTKVASIYLPSYVPYSTAVVDAEGNEYDGNIKDLYYIWAMLKTYSYDRDEWLYDTEMYDDNYIRTRKIVEQNKKYTPVLNDVQVSKDDWGGVYTAKFYKIVMEDTNTVEWDSKEDPINMPTVNSLKGLVYKTSSKDNFLGQVYQAENLLKSINGKAVNYPWFSQIKFKRSELDGYDQISFTILGNKNYIDSIVKDCPENFFFENSDHDSFAAATIIDKSSGKTNPELKSEFESRYASATTAVKADIYDDPELYDYYHNFDYYVTIKCQIDSIDSDNYNTELLLQSTIGKNSIVNYTKNLINKLVNYLQGARNQYKNTDDMAKEAELDPETNYPKYIKMLETLNAANNNADACLYALNKICGEIKTFVIGRAKALYNATTNEKNAQKFVNVIKIRLNKTHGSLLQCYGNLLGLDPQYKKLSCQAGLIDTSGLLVSRAKTDSADPNAFINAETNPNYIDIENVNRTYFGNRKFYSGDTVYIIGDGCVEFKAKVVSVQAVYLKESDYENAEQKEDGSIDNVLTKRSYCTRLVLSSKLPDYYCKNCNTSNIRVMKLT